MNDITEEVPVSVSENDSNISRAELLKNYMPKIYHKISRLVWASHSRGFS